MVKKIFDIVVFGATGDAGRCVCHFLHNKGKLIGVKSWSPAARNLKKLNVGIDSLVSETRVVPADGVGCGTPIAADANDYDSVLKMCQQAKVVIACAGPFADYGENVVKACVEAGSDYVDITGETPWVNVMAKKYGAEAKRKGVSVLSQAAYDSVPSDITVALAAEALREEGEVISATETHHTMKGGAMPTGTLNTALNVMLAARRSALSALTFGVVGGPTAEEKAKAASLKEEKALLKNAAGLVPKIVSKAIASDGRSNMLVPYTKLSQCWSLPHFMASVNTPIVHTTAQALGYGVTEGNGFSYRERISNLKGGFVPFATTMLAFVLGMIVTMPVFIPFVALFPESARKAMVGLNNADFGNAKAKAFKKLFNGYQPNGLTRTVAIASSASGKVTAKVTFRSEYDAGLGFTALSAATVAGAVLAKRAAGEKGNGFETAVAAIGPAFLRDEYKKAGVTIDAQIMSKL